MNPLRSILVLTAALLVLSSAPAGATAQEAYDYLTSAKATLETSDSQAPAKRGKRANRGENRVEKQLIHALASLEVTKNNRGSALPLAKKAIEAAQAELAKGLTDETRAKALEYVNEALKQTQKAIDTVRR